MFIIQNQFFIRKYVSLWKNKIIFITIIKCNITSNKNRFEFKKVNILFHGLILEPLIQSFKQG